MEKNATLKRRNPQWVCQLAVLVLATIAKTGSALVCDEVVYVKYGKRAVIPCTCEPGFDIVSWYKDEDFTSNQPPFIYLDASGKNGPGYDSHQYDLDQNGSLIIYNVSLSDDDCFMVTAVKFNSERRSVQREVHVTVISGPHDPVYPVVNDFIYQQHVYMDVNRKGPLTCSLYHVHPVVNLTWNVLDPSHKDKIEFFDVAIRNTLNADGTFNMFLDSNYIVEDLSLRRIAIQCEVTDEISEYFAETTKVDLLFPPVFFIPVFPTVNGFTNQQHVYLDTDRKGRLNCSKRNVIPSAHLSWEVVDPVLKQKITFQSETNRSRNMDGTVDIFLTSEFSVEDDRLERITIQCRVLGVAEDDYPNVTTVDLLFPDVFPTVNGLTYQQHVYLDTYRTGQLNCSKRNVSPSAHLRWEVVDPVLKPKITFQSETNRLSNMDGTVDIFLTSEFSVEDDRLERITIQCRVLGVAEDDYPNVTTVDLLFPDAPPVPPAPPVPVIEGCFSQQDGCVLRMPRKGELACGVMKSHQQVDLRWKCDEDLFILKEDRMVIKNHSDVFDVFIFTSYYISDEVLDLVTIQCEVIGWRGEAPSAAKVSLVLEKAAEPGLEIKVNFLLGIQLVLLCGVSILICARKRKRRTFRNRLEMYVHCISKGSRDGTGTSTRSQNTEQELTHHSPKSSKGSKVAQESAACGDLVETTELMSIAENGGIGFRDTKNERLVQPLLSESGREVATDNREKKDFRDAKNERLVQTFLKDLQLLYEKYLSHKRDIEDTVAIINEEEKDENKME
ncbi:hypothetical protein HOLleu_43014 [Holothuria leucospilota]|uniref:Immunoglobulin domain-containing protein n=1 Tax=Holothuria leucospilota TaxID=206669 RepID=A0A9Q1BBB9_HOLLE|nr:hypothetical protein HOLleu_43014 [Holothuria leucospilota]